MEGIIFQPVNYSGHAFTEGLHARRDPGHGHGFYVFGRNSEKYGRKPDGSGAYVAMVARPDVKPRRHPHYNCAVELRRARISSPINPKTIRSLHHG